MLGRLRPSSENPPGFIRGECQNNYVSPTFAGQVADALEEAAGGWHSVKDGAPDDYKPVLFFTAAGDYIAGYYDSECKAYCDRTGFRHIVTHWRELPAEPDKE